MGRGRCQTEFAIFSPDSRNARQNIREGAKIVQQGPEPRFVNESSFVCFEEMQLGGLCPPDKICKGGCVPGGSSSRQGYHGPAIAPCRYSRTDQTFSVRPE